MKKYFQKLLSFALIVMLALMMNASPVFAYGTYETDYVSHNDEINGFTIDVDFIEYMFSHMEYYRANAVFYETEGSFATLDEALAAIAEMNMGALEAWDDAPTARHAGVHGIRIYTVSGEDQFTRSWSRSHTVYCIFQTQQPLPLGTLTATFESRLIFSDRVQTTTRGRAMFVHEAIVTSPDGGGSWSGYTTLAEARSGWANLGNNAATFISVIRDPF